jgi:hypothetical protein
MLRHKTALVPTALMLLSVMALPGCSSSDNKKKNPPPPPPVQIAVAKFDLTTKDLPYPMDPIFFLGTTDGTLNLPATPFRPAAMTTALNSLDGWSTSSSPWTGFSLPIDPASLSGSTVIVVKVYLNPGNKAPVDVTDPTQVAAYLPAGHPIAVLGPLAGPPLTYGTDYTASVDGAIDSNGQYLKITPLKPFDFSKGPAVTGGKILNVGYIVILTNGIKAKTGQTMGPDTLYASFLAAPADCSTIADATQKIICKFTQPQISIAQKIGVTKASMILSWSFSTQSIDDTFNVIAATGSAKTTQIVPTGKTTANAGGLGKADIYIGSTVLPYYLTATDQTQTLAQQNAAVNGSFWKAAGPPPLAAGCPNPQVTPDPAHGCLDQTSRNLSMFNPGPVASSPVTVPILVTVPRIGSSACAVMPAGGWPVAIVQHGIGGARWQALAMADGFADQCYIVVSMDLPLHGITSLPTDPDPFLALLGQFHCYAPPHAANPACLGAVERTFDVDLAAPTGIDISGAYFINLPNPITGRDNLREAEADLTQLTKSLAGQAPLGLTVAAAGGSLPAGRVNVDATRISYVGLSLGAIVGGAHAHFSNDTRTVALSVPGGTVTQLLAESQTFGPSINAALAKLGLATNGSLYGQFFRDFQAVVDGGDPINHIKDAQNMHPTLLFKVLNDTVVPNNSTDRLITAGGLSKITTLGNIAIGPGTGKWSFFKIGSHGTLFSPAPPGSLSATGEMQTQAIGFSASGGTVPVGLYDASVLDLTP